MVSTVSGVIDPNTGAVQMRATFDNAGHVLRSGGTGSILIPTHAENALIIPQKATYEIQNKKFVYVLGAGNKVQSREIEVLVQNDGQNYVVSSGLKAGEKIVVDGVNKLKNDMVITPITHQQAAAAEKKAKQALKDGKVDCVVIDQEPAKNFVAVNEGLKILDTEYVTEDYAIAVAKENTALKDAINAAMAELKEDGTIQGILDKYISAE